MPSGVYTRTAKQGPNHRHGMTGTRFHKCWIRIRQRCFDPNSTKFSYYGGRGIKVCKRWNNFLNFKKDMYGHYLIHCSIHGVKETTIDRINNDGDYTPNNCRWATVKVQNSNKRKMYRNNHLFKK